MKNLWLYLLTFVLGVAPVVAHAQSEEEIRKKVLEELKPLIQKEVQRQVQAALAAAENNAPASVETNRFTAAQVQQLTDKVDQVIEAQRKVLPSEFNPAIGVVGETVFSYRPNSSEKTGSERPGGFDIFQRSVELNATANVDPFTKAYIVANASAETDSGEASFGIEEAAVQTTALPWNLGLTAGRFFGEFGRLSNIHDHELPFVNRPMVLDEYIGGESRTDGVQLNWLLPVDHYISLTAGVGNGFGGEDPFQQNPGPRRSFRGLSIWGRLSSAFDLSPNWGLETGLSGLVNDKTQSDGEDPTLIEKQRQLAGLDLKLTYRPLRDNQFRSFTFGAETLYSDNSYLANPDGIENNGDEFNQDVGSLGLYSYVNYKWSRKWSAGFLYDWMQSAQDSSDETAAYSPFITYALSHGNQLRLQYTHTDHSDVSGLEDNDAVYLQWAWIIGSHSHGWQQR